jgi:hypothetical protein
LIAGVAAAAATQHAILLAGIAGLVAVAADACFATAGDFGKAGSPQHIQPDVA